MQIAERPLERNGTLGALISDRRREDCGGLPLRLPSRSSRSSVQRASPEGPQDAGSFGLGGRARRPLANNGSLSAIYVQVPSEPTVSPLVTDVDALSLADQVLARTSLR
jgi:hypothetical protein